MASLMAGDLADLPLISCVMPTYGRPKYVNESVAMFLAQDYPRKELIILNDCAGQTYHFDHPDILIVNRRRRFATLGQKRNKSIEIADGELIAVWDDDDVYLPWRLSLSWAEMKTNNTPFYRAASFLAYWGSNELDDNESVHGWVNHPNTLFTKSLWRDVGGYPAQGIGEDAVFFQHIHERLGADFIKYPISPEDRFFILRGKSHYAHLSHGGGLHPLDETEGEFVVTPQPIDDLVLREAYDERVQLRMRFQAASVSITSVMHTGCKRLDD